MSMRSPPPAIVAIDPGVNGGFAISNIAIAAYPMPKAMTDILTLLRDISEACDNNLVVVMEEPPKFIAGMQTAQSAMATLHENVGYLKGVIDTLGIPLKLVKPKVWQQAIEAGDKKSYGNKWKAHLKDMALRRFPYLGKKVTLKTADALLILAYVIDSKPAKKEHYNGKLH